MFDSVANLREITHSIKSALASLEYLELSNIGHPVAQLSCITLEKTQQMLVDLTAYTAGNKPAVVAHAKNENDRR